MVEYWTNDNSRSESYQEGYKQGDWHQPEKKPDDADYYLDSYPTIKELFGDIWGNPSPQDVYETETVCTHESSDRSACWNGGDYDHFIHKKDRWMWCSDSSDFSGSIDARAGYVFGCPVILMGFNGEYNPYEIVWENGSRTTISAVEAANLQQLMQAVIQSDSRIDWCSPQEWSQIVNHKNQWN